MKRVWLIGLTLMGAAQAAEAVTVTLEQATQMALQADPRIEEQRANVAAAQALIQKVAGEGGVRASVNLYAGLAPKASNGIYTNGTNTCAAGPGCTLRSDGMSLNDGITVSTGIMASIIQPLYTFGKLENYRTAAEYNKKFKTEEVALAKGQTWLTVRRAYYGYLTARDTRQFLLGVRQQLADTEAPLTKKAEEGKVPMRDVYALQSGLGQLDRYIAEAQGVEAVALDGLKTIIGVPIKDELTVADAHIEPVALPSGNLQQFAQQALDDRPEMKMAQNGLAALRAYVAARKADYYPDLYAGILLAGQYTPGRQRIDNPYLYDPFNMGLATPVIGLKWDFNPGVLRANVSDAEAQLQGAVAKAQLAQVGIPYQVSEAYHGAESLKQQIAALDKARAASRRWMISSFLDFQAGLVDGGVLALSVTGNTQTQVDYLRAINDYNMKVAELKLATGDYPQ
ncbi:TolC family protein [Halothiobacillus sp. DCM-1]|uniref:TolC family protein n=1 Tax=Halothiobacillus sp. DCM-1 TaxID=3112558 RepID=UPI00324B3813